LSRRLGTVTRSPGTSYETLVARGFGYSLLAAKSAEASGPERSKRWLRCPFQRPVRTNPIGARHSRAATSLPRRKRSAPSVILTSPGRPSGGSMIPTESASSIPRNTYPEAAPRQRFMPGGGVAKGSLVFVLWPWSDRISIRQRASASCDPVGQTDKAT